ncbi:MAG: AAA domain-containing protein [Firmicutes bacterium]|nr:AAA domain-containing protein [Bacillota bacterium]
MSIPHGFERRNPVHLKLGIKSSIETSQIKPLLSVLYVVWRLNGKSVQVDYSTEIQGHRIAFTSELIEHMTQFFSNEISAANLDSTTVETLLNQNGLVAIQYESLMVALELVWRLAKIEFVDPELPASSERTGGVRYPKRLSYTKNIDILDLLVESNESDFRVVLFNWLFGQSLEVNAKAERDLVKLFTIFSEEALFKLVDQNGENILFNNCGVYSRLVSDVESVNIVGSSEVRGSLRILGSSVRAGANYYLSYSSDGVVLAESSLREELAEYCRRVNNYHDLWNIAWDLALSNSRESASNSDKEELHLPLNKIISGAPGTGKSYSIEVLIKNGTFRRENTERVTFHPSYSYSQFVGTFRPKPLFKCHLDSSRLSPVPYKEEQLLSSDVNQLYPIPNEPIITYEYVAGPFLRLLTRAIAEYQSLGESANRYLLVIEELNRANVSAVFGDMFQLLDRRPNGESEYRIAIPEEMQQYLLSHGLLLEQLYLPPNFYIWATMNNADQGVHPVDTAFKRRWDFDYIDINSGEDELPDLHLNVAGVGWISWNDLRIAINNKLLELRIKEDKLLGPFFLTVDELTTSDELREVFKSKVLPYLFEDVLKMKRDEFFLAECKSLGLLMKQFSSQKPVFSFDVRHYMDNANEDTQEEDGRRNQE